MAQDRRRLHGAFFIQLHRIRPDPAQPRKNLDTQDHRELTASVKKYGVIQPISVRLMEGRGFFQIISGERRFHAATAAGHAEIPCIVHEPNDSEILARQLVENWQRVDLHPYEIADALASLKEADGCSQRELAELTGKSEAEISKLLALVRLDPAAQKLARADETGRITRRHLYAASQLPPEKQRPLLEQVQATGMTAEQTEQTAARAKPTQGKPAKRGAPVLNITIPTTNATVRLVFRRKEASTADILAALDEARAYITKPKPEVNIVRVK